MPIVHHPDDATLMSFAAGALPEALSAVVSTHLVACSACRSRVRDMEDLGAAMVHAMDQHGGKPADDRHAALKLIERAEREDEASLAPRSVGDHVTLDAEDAMVRLTGSKLEDIPWKRLGWGVWHYPLALQGERGGDLRLIKVQKGQAMPEHGHGGSELTLVLSGAYHDEIGTFSAGDVADLDDSVEHRPIADAKDGCICLIASDRRARFTGVLGRLLQPITGL